jgi:hypothetical protein
MALHFSAADLLYTQSSKDLSFASFQNFKISQQGDSGLMWSNAQVCHIRPLNRKIRVPSSIIEKCAISFQQMRQVDLNFFKEHGPIERDNLLKIYKSLNLWPILITQSSSRFCFLSTY